MNKRVILPLTAGLLLVTIVILVLAGMNSESNTEKGPSYDGLSSSFDHTSYAPPENVLDSIVNVVYSFDRESKTIERIALEVLSPRHDRLSYVFLPADARYFCSQALYNELSVDLITIPQEITFNRLYSYYGKKDAFLAGAKIIGEMCGVSRTEYTVLSSDYFDEVFEVSESFEGLIPSLKLSTDDVKSGEDGKGSVKAYLLEHLKGVKTTWPAEERLTYLELYDSLRESDILLFSADGEKTDAGTNIDSDKLKSLILDIV